jgi:hypothetical protein
MKHSSHATIEGAPRFEIRCRSEPIGISCGVEGALRASIGAINARVGRVPITLAIPFLGGVQTVGAVGPFELELDPVDVSVERFELRCDGVLGPDGLVCGLEGGVDCKWEIDLAGVVPGRVARASVEFMEEEEER